MCLHYFNFICKEIAGARLFIPILSTLPATFSVWLWPTGYNSCLPRWRVCWLKDFSCARKQCHENHPWGGRIDDPDGAQQRFHLPHECAWHPAQPASQQAGEPRRARGCHCHGHQAEDYWDFTGRGPNGREVTKHLTVPIGLTSYTFCSRSILC